jgi:hypothetical protein
MGQFSELHAAMHSVAPAGKNSRVTASIQKMSSAEATSHARTILRLYLELAALEQSVRAPAEFAVEKGTERPPRFLVGGRR